MNICYISDVDISLPNGPGVNEREFVWTLQIESGLKGDTVSFIIPKPSNDIDFKIENVHYMRKPAGLLNLPLNPVLNYGVLKSIRKIVKDTQHDIFVIRINSSILLVPLALSLWKKPYCIKTLGNIYKFEKHSSSFKLKISFMVVRKILSLVLTNALVIDVCTPQFHYNYCKTYNLRNIQVIENSVNTKRFYPMDKNGCKVRCGLKNYDYIIGYVGGYPSKRGAKQLIDITPMLIQKYPSSAVLIVGEDDGLEQLRSHAEETGIAEHVIFAGVINYQDLNIYMNCLDVGVAFDRLEIINAVGNSSQKIRQYLACGVPIVCAQKTNEYIVRDGLGIAASPEDLDAVFRSIIYWLEKSSEDKVSFRKKAYQYANKKMSVQTAYNKRYIAWKAALSQR